MAVKKWSSVAVIGRCPYDDEDSCYVFHNATVQQALKEFRLAMRDDSIVNDSERNEDDEPYIVHILTSDGRIKYRCS